MILLSAGHYPADPGACFGSFCEHAEAVRWVERIANEIVRIGYDVDLVPTGPLAVYADKNLVGGKVWWINERHKKTPIDIVVEVHFNSDSAHRGIGCETLYCPGSLKGQQAASILQAVMTPILSPGRGIKEGWYRQDKPGHVDYPGDVDGDEKIDCFLKATDPVALIIEPEFVHNKDVIAINRERACLAIALGIVQSAKGVNT